MTPPACPRLGGRSPTVSFPGIWRVHFYPILCFHQLLGISPQGEKSGVRSQELES